MGRHNKTFVSFDGDTDIHYYRLMCAWKQSDHTAPNGADLAREWLYEHVRVAA